MPWPNASRRRAELPTNWPDIRAAVLDRDGHVCQIRGPRCTGRANQVDHAGDRDDHRLHALRAACRTCHAQRTATQGHDSMRQIRTKARHPVEQHPGLR
jgi:5-methylcytosine-specific restriction enzyme A